MKKLLSSLLAFTMLAITIIPVANATTDPTVLLNLSFEKAYGYSVQNADGGTVERVENYDSTHGSVMHMGISGVKSTSTYIDVAPTGLESQNNYVIEVKFKPVKITGSARIVIGDAKQLDSAGKSTWRYGFQAYHTTETGWLGLRTYDKYYFKPVSGGSASKELSLNTWYRMDAVYNISAGTCDYYIDKTKVGTQTISTTTKPQYVRIDAEGAADGAVEFYLDDYRIYKGSSIRDDILVPDYDNYSIMDDNDLALQFLENDGDEYQAFSVLGNYYYKDGSRRKYTDATHPIMVKDGDDDTYGTSTAYVPLGFVSSIYGKSGSLSDYGTVRNVDGTDYIKASEFASALGKQFYYDKRGLFVISDSEYPYKDGDHFIDMFETADLIYRTLQFQNPTGEEMLNAYKSSDVYGQHPRLLYTQDDIAYIKQKATTDSDYSTAVTYAESLAKGHLNRTDYTADCPDANKQTEASNFQNSIITLATAYLLTGDTTYSDKGIEYMLTFCQWSDLGWKVANLTTGHWAMGMAIGYDSFYDVMTEEQRDTVKTAVVNMPFADTITAYQGGGGVHWINIKDNFSGVIGGGLMALTLAFADEDDLQNSIEYLLENIYKTNELSVALYETNGGYFEGVGYSNYMLDNFATGTEALFHCCGTDFDLGTGIGFANANDFFTYMMTPNSTFNFHDCASSASGGGLTYWFAYRYGNIKPAELQRLYRNTSPTSMGVRYLLMYDKAVEKYGEPTDVDIPLDKYFPITEAGSFRDSFSSSQPNFVGFHAGRTKLTHDMLDLGEFTYETDGQVWAMDLGGDDYDLPSYFGTIGYRIYRKRPEGENCIVINPTNQYDSDGTTEYYGQTLSANTSLIDFKTSDSSAYAVYDLTDGYKRDVDSYKRGYYFGDGRSSLIVQDEIDLKKTSSEVYWFMHTKANINVVDNHTAVLTLGGKTLKAEVYCNDPTFELTKMAAEPLPSSPTVEGQAVNTGVTKLTVHVASSSSDKVNIAVKLIPISNGQSYKELSYNSISSWTTDDATYEKVTVLSPSADEPIADNSVVFSIKGTSGETPSFSVDGNAIKTPTETNGVYTTVVKSTTLGYGRHVFTATLGDVTKTVVFNVVKPVCSPTNMTYSNTSKPSNSGTKTSAKGPNGENGGFKITRASTDTFLYYAPGYTSGTYFFESDIKADKGVTFNLEAKNSSGSFIWLGEATNLIPSTAESNSWHHIRVLQDVAANGQFYVYFDGKLISSGANSRDISSIASFKVQVGTLENGSVTFYNTRYGTYTGYDYAKDITERYTTPVCAGNVVGVSSILAHGTTEACSGVDGKTDGAFALNRGDINSFLYYSVNYTGGTFVFDTDIKATDGAGFDLEAKNKDDGFVWNGNSRNLLSYMSDQTTWHHLRVEQEISTAGNYRTYVDGVLVDRGTNANDLSSLKSFKIQVLNSGSIYLDNTSYTNVDMTLDELEGVQLNPGTNIYWNVYKSQTGSTLPTAVDMFGAIFDSTRTLGVDVNEADLQAGKNEFYLNIPSLTEPLTTKTLIWEQGSQSPVSVN